VPVYIQYAYVVEVEVKLLYDWRSVGHPFGAHDQVLLFPFFCRTIAVLFILGRPLIREDGSVICSAICQWSESWRTHNHTLLSHLRLLGSLSVASYDSQGLQWKYSYPPPHGEYSYVQTCMSISKPCLCCTCLPSCPQVSIAHMGCIVLDD
jgi:hypothetical protein